jgi:hypothetical protein
MDQKNNAGALFKNDKKTTENHPDYTGKAIIEGHITLLPKMYEAVGAGKPRLLMSVKKAETKLKQRMEIVGTKQDIEKKQLAESV